MVLSVELRASPAQCPGQEGTLSSGPRAAPSKADHAFTICAVSFRTFFPEINHGFISCLVFFEPPGNSSRPSKWPQGAISTTWATTGISQSQLVMAEMSLSTLLRCARLPFVVISATPQVPWAILVAPLVWWATLCVYTA